MLEYLILLEGPPISDNARLNEYAKQGWVLVAASAGRMYLERRKTTSVEVVVTPGEVTIDDTINIQQVMTNTGMSRHVA